ncbi:MAG: hypothetical protein R3246_15705 [Acidimicrobiia bacterium]|nr:hypothetical protein [Acidimicrobiia bacterium]
MSNPGIGGVDLRRDDGRPSAHPKWRQFYLGMAIYTVLVVVQSILLEPGSVPIPVMIVLAPIPVVPVVWALLGWFEVLRSRDELQRRIFTEAATLSLGITGALAISYGFLEAYANLPKLSMFWVWAVIGAAFVLGQLVAGRRYR